HVHGAGSGRDGVHGAPGRSRLRPGGSGMNIVRAACAATAAVLLALPAAAQDVAIRNATVLTITNGTIEDGTVVVRHGRIAAVGGDVTIRQGMRVIDGTGMYLMRGIIDAHSHMAIEGGINEGSESVTPEVIVPVRDDDITIYRALAGGVTSALLLHGSANPMGGQGAVIKMRRGQPADSLYFDGAHRSVKFALGENVTRASSSAPDSLRRFPKTRMGVEQTLRWWFSQAQEYDREWAEYR